MPQGVYSEVGRLRKVIVCRPGLAHTRLTPANCKELLFDDVIWVAQAKNDHYALMLKKVTTQASQEVSNAKAQRCKEREVED